jgi:hypothetical protein
MGLNIHMIKILFEMMDILEIYEFKDLNICELGNLYIAKDLYPFLKSKGIPLYHLAKDLFIHLGFNDTSIDLNGKDGALSINLGMSIKNNLKQKFDIVINGGTTEHVDNQYFCWKNIHDLCKKGALIISVTPLDGNMFNHSFWRYSLGFFNCLAFVNNYDLLERKVIALKKKKGFDCSYLCFRRNDGEFISRELFVKIWNNNNEVKMI